MKTEPLVLPEKARAKVEAKTLVLYVYAGSDPEAKQNLLYFIREGIQVNGLLIFFKVVFKLYPHVALGMGSPIALHASPCC